MMSRTKRLESVDGLRQRISPNLELVSLPLRSACHSSHSDCSRVAISIVSTMSSFPLKIHDSLQQKV